MHRDRGAQRGDFSSYIRGSRLPMGEVRAIEEGIPGREIVRANVWRPEV